MLTLLTTRIVDLSRRSAWFIILLSLAGGAFCAWYVSAHFKINTDVNQLLADDLPWRQREKVLEKAFPQKVDLTVVVVDADTSDAAEDAAAALAARLSKMPEQFSYVSRPDGIPFFRKNGLLFLPQEETSQILNSLVEAQPLLGSVASDPSLRGLFSMFNLQLQGLEHGMVDYRRLDKPFDAIAKTVESALAGKDRPIAWQSIMSDTPADMRDLRKLILVKPVLRYDELQPGQIANNAIRDTAKFMGLTPDRGVNVRLTGSVPLNDEEFATVAEGTGFATILSGVLVIIILLLALRSLRLILPILITLVAGLAATTAVALAAVGSLNLISVAFAVMFIGIAVDFGIQFGVRYRDQHHEEPDHARALLRTAAIIAIPLALAAASTALGFLSFMPTDYRGVSELGFIAGIGMIIAFVLTVTLFPALLSVFHPPAEPEAIGFRWMAPVDRFAARHRRKILLATLAIAVSASIVASRVRFDFDPINLKDPDTESVSTLHDLMKDPNFNPYTVDVLRPSLEEARQTAAALRNLPEVDHVLTLDSFVPDDQDARLSLIADTRMILEPTLDPAAPAPPPTDEQVYETMATTIAGLNRISKDHASAERLARALAQVGKRHDPELLERLKADLVDGIIARIDAARKSLGAEKITADNIPADLRNDWMTPQGEALVQVYPKGNIRDRDTLIAFTKAVQRLVPDASGAPVSILESGRTVTTAFIHAGMYALATITMLLLLILRRPRDVLMLVLPLILAGILTLATIVIIGLPLNFANIIALPLLLSLGVSYAIYFVSYWRNGHDMPLQSSMARAVLFSAATALAAFGTLGLSSHPGTASMGDLLTVALLYSLTCTFFILPALLGKAKADRHG
ncbi:MAG: MMPL family transporter [Bdellovibrionales bacterium]